MLLSSLLLPVPFLTFFLLISYSAFNWLGFFYISFDIGVLLVVYYFFESIMYLCLC